MGLTGPLSIPQAPYYAVENLVFKNQRITLDGYHFKNCAFVDCVLRTLTGKFKIEECYLQGSFWLAFADDALRVARLASLVDWNEATAEVRAIYHPNGGVSIP
jgi:hypothetical protein